MIDRSRSNERKRRTPYVPGVAALNFRPDHDWEFDEAKQLYEGASFPFQVDHVLYEDCIAGMHQLPPESVDLVIADPPFGIEFDGRGSQYNRNADLVVEGYREVGTDYDVFTREWITELPRIMKDTSSAFIFSGWTHLSDILVAVKHAGLSVINHIIWKYQFGVFTRRKFVTSHYHILFLAKDPRRYYFNKIEHYPLDVWDIPRTYRPGQKKNSTKLPERVVCRCIDFATRPGDLVLDPFMGNGTTAVCAKARFRHFLGFEVNQSMRGIIQEQIDATKAGQDYRPYHTIQPSREALAKKYPSAMRLLSGPDRCEDDQPADI
ncbi:MAG: site-specific DNA-methyltransferase [Candidatus Thorarchaeota archaeon]